MCIFLTNVLQNIRKRCSAKLLDGGTRHGHTLSQPAHNVEQRSARQQNVIRTFEMLHNKKEERKAGEGVCVCVWGGGVGDRLESHIETHSIFVVFYCICCCFCTVGGGG